jgi:enoyl-CoA hydratase/carnithine racemase
MTTARRYGGEDARAAGIVEHAVIEDAVTSTAVELAAAHAGRAGPTLGTIETCCGPPRRRPPPIALFGGVADRAGCERSRDVVGAAAPVPAPV